MIRGTGGLNFFGGGDIQQTGKIQTFWLAGRLPPILPLSGASRSAHKKNSEMVLYLLTVMILKRVSESIFFQMNEFTASLKIKKEVTNSLI